MEKIEIEIGKNLLEAIKEVIKGSPNWKSSHLVQDAFNLDFEKICEKYFINKYVLQQRRKKN